MEGTEDVTSHVLGWLSIGSWIIVYSPQFIENYQLKSGEGLSVAFVLVWIAGDIASLIGAALAHLLPTIIILAVYYSFCDIGLLLQIYYYRYSHPVHIAPPATLEPDESTPLLAPLLKESNEQQPTYLKFLRRLAPYMLGSFFVLAVGTVAYWVKVKGRSEGHEHTGCGSREDVFEWRSQLLGWMSAVFFLGSRIPQILKNLTTKCAGLSPILFFFAVAGNATYVASILVISRNVKYLAVNASWLAGSGLTIFLDLFVLVQFIYFRTTELVFVPDGNPDASQAPEA